MASPFVRLAWSIVALASWVIGAATVDHVGGRYAAMFAYDSGQRVSSLWYTVPVLAILLAHECGHATAALLAGVGSRLPVLFPWPLGWATVPGLSPAGVIGAYVHIDSMAALSPLARFDLAWAGVMAGAITAALCAVLGALLSHPLTGVHVVAGQWNPALITILTGQAPWAWHPLLVAGRFGWVLTLVSLVPVWPLDGWYLWSALPVVWRTRRLHVILMTGVVVACLL